MSPSICKSNKQNDIHHQRWWSFISVSPWHTLSYMQALSRLVEHGGGKSGPVPFADINTGRLICPLPLGRKAAVMAAQLSFNKEKNTQTNRSHRNNRCCIRVCVLHHIDAYVCRILLSYRSWQRRSVWGQVWLHFSTVADGSLNAKAAFSKSNIQVFSAETV